MIMEGRLARDGVATDSHADKKSQRHPVTQASKKKGKRTKLKRKIVSLALDWQTLRVDEGPGRSDQP